MFTLPRIVWRKFNSLRPRLNRRPFADDIFKCIFLNENELILPGISVKFVPALVQVMVWCRPGDKPLSEPMMVSLLTHICVTQPQWVKQNNSLVSELICCLFKGIRRHFVYRGLKHMRHLTVLWSYMRNITLYVCIITSSSLDGRFHLCLQGLFAAIGIVLRLQGKLRYGLHWNRAR